MEKTASKKSGFIWLLAFLFVILVILTGIYFYNLYYNMDLCEVPSVVNLSLSEAKKVLRTNNLSVSVEERFSEKVDEGFIISQKPEAGTEISMGSSVELGVSKGREKYIVPDVRNMVFNKAENKLNDAGFVVSVIKNSNIIGENILVKNQEPVPGTQLVKNAEVVLILDKGNKRNDVPPVAGLNRTEAIDCLRNSGFKYTLVEEYSKTVNKDVVIEQHPVHGTKLFEGSKVKITVSLGEQSECVHFPDENLKKLVLKTLGKTEGEIYENDVTKILSLNAYNSSINNLEGMQYLKNLRTLNLQNNNISDITPLEELEKLEILYLGNNNISDISPVWNLQNLKRLNAEQNEIENIKPLANLKGIEILTLYSNKIKDVRPLAYLHNLNTLYLSSNEIIDISALGELSGLECLNIKDNFLSDYKPLENLENTKVISDIQND